MLTEPWLCACGEMTLVSHWAWPNGVGVHDPELAYLEAAGLAKQGPTQNDSSPTPGGTMIVDTTHLHGTTDALVWAETFTKVRAARLAQDGVDIADDEGTMLGWFANAFMAQKDSDRG